MTITPEEAVRIEALNAGGVGVSREAELICELAGQIAGMSPEYRAEFQTAGGRWFPTPHRCSCSSGWGTKQQAARHAAEWKADGYATRIVRRVVGEPEVID